MATVIKIKTGTATPTTSDITDREVAIDKTAQKFYINDGGTIKEIAGAAAQGNAFANIHNAKKAFSPMINIVGDHASYHLKHNAPLTSDLDGLAKSSSDWVRRVGSPEQITQCGNDAWKVANEPPGNIATLIVPADYAWSNIQPDLPKKVELNNLKSVDNKLIEAAYKLLLKPNSMLYLGGKFLDEECLKFAAQIATKTGCRLATDTFVSRIRRGAGLPIIQQVPYFSEMAEDFLQ